MAPAKTKRGRQSRRPRFRNLQSASNLVVRRWPVGLTRIGFLAAIGGNSGRRTCRSRTAGCSGFMALPKSPSGLGRTIGLSGNRLSWQLTRHALQISIRRPRIETVEHPLQRLTGGQSAISETSDHEERNSERTVAWRTLRKKRDRRTINSLSHRFSTGFDFVPGRLRPATAHEGGSGALHSLRLLVH